MSEKLNEETVKNRYLVPFLRRLGFDDSELAFETRFTVRIGRNSVVPSCQVGVLDILVSRGDKNLFVVEAKRQDEELTADDRDQGISYASLVRPIAPFVLLTNGDEFRLFDTLSKEEVSEDAASPNGGSFNVALPHNLVEDAIRHFFGLSTANVTAFSRAQATEEMAPLLGSRKEPHRKFIPELFTERASFDEEVERFSKAPTHFSRS